MTDSVVKTKIVVKMPSSLFVKEGDTKWRGTTFIVKTNNSKMGSYEVFFDWELTQDGALPTGIHLVSKTGSRVSSDLFRSGIPLKELLDTDVKAQAEIRRQAPDTIKFVAKNLGKAKGLELSSTPPAATAVTATAWCRPPPPCATPPRSAHWPMAVRPGRRADFFNAMAI